MLSYDNLSITVSTLYIILSTYLERGMKYLHRMLHQKLTILGGLQVHTVIECSHQFSYQVGVKLWSHQVTKLVMCTCPPNISCISCCHVTRLLCFKKHQIWWFTVTWVLHPTNILHMIPACSHQFVKIKVDQVTKLNDMYMIHHAIFCISILWSMDNYSL